MMMRRAVRGALTSRPYRPTVSIATRFTHDSSRDRILAGAYAAEEHDVRVVKDDSFDFWTYRTNHLESSTKNTSSLRKSLIDKFSPLVPTDSGVELLKAIINQPDLNHSYKTLNTFLDYNTTKKVLTRSHWNALLERESIHGNPAEIRSIFNAMTALETPTDQQSYVYLYKSYWKNGTLGDLVAVIREMIFLNLTPTPALVQHLNEAHKAAGVKEPNLAQAITYVSDEQARPSSERAKNPTNSSPALDKLTGLHARVQLYYALNKNE